HVHAWAEFFAFSGERNLAHGAAVHSSKSMSPAAPWHWRKSYLVDGQTPLGLPEEVGEPHRNVGWISNGRKDAFDSAWLEVDLGKVCAFDGLQLFPARRPTADLPSGFGFPKQFEVVISEVRIGGGEGKEAERVVVASGRLPNPGHSPFYFPLEESEGRYVRIRATELWKEFDGYPAFFALSEVQVLAGEENLAEGKPVRSPDGMGNVVAPGSRYWSAVSLSDGYGPEGRLISKREWLLQLQERLVAEALRYELSEEATAIVDDWRRIGITLVSLLAVAGAFVLVVLPVRYRIREKRELAKVRERIAGDLHDEVGSNLGSIQMFADLAEGRSGPSDELKRIQRIAAETVSAVRDIVWLLRPGRDHRIGTVEHLRETASIMLERLEWDFTADEHAWECELSDEQNRHLFLFFREALHNILRHASAAKVRIRAEIEGGQFLLVVADDGRGIDDRRLARPSTLRALRQRVAALQAAMEVETAAGEGTCLKLGIPLTSVRKRAKE
ncbi:MAG: histidine kinase, partial [Verrucomicrobiales bacterium]